MQEHNLRHYHVEIDKSATSVWYEATDHWGCECGHCRNFLRLAEMKKLPLHVTQMLDQLEIPAEKATYVCALHTDDRGILYQFSYRIAGNILDAPNREDVEEVRCCHEPYPYGAPNFPQPHFDLEFFAILPWVLDEV